jgi:hypothetical protein
VKGCQAVASPWVPLPAWDRWGVLFRRCMSAGATPAVLVAVVAYPGPPDTRGQAVVTFGARASAGAVMRRGLPRKRAAVLERRLPVIAVTCVVVLGASLGVGLFLSGGQHQRSLSSPPPVASGLLPPPQSPLPALRINLAGWKLSIPEVNDKGDATTLQPAALKAPWLTPTPDGGLMFWAPTSGATTKNSDHPRTELDSLTNFKAGEGAHTLTASVTPLQVPQDGGGVILDQIHRADDISGFRSKAKRCATRPGTTSRPTTPPVLRTVGGSSFITAVMSTQPRHRRGNQSGNVTRLW